MASAGHKLKEAREGEGMSAPKLATYSGLSEKTIRDIENEKRSGSEVTWSKILRGLNKNPEKSKTWKRSDFK
jgi:transcriptional regulator with XRE-family HTH domain